MTLDWVVVPPPFPEGLAAGLGLPEATAILRALVGDGALWCAHGQDEHGVVATVTHTAQPAVNPLVAGRLPLLDEIWSACGELPPDHQLAVVLPPYVAPLQRRWSQPLDGEYRIAPGLATTV